MASFLSFLPLPKYSHAAHSKDAFRKAFPTSRCQSAYWGNRTELPENPPYRSSDWPLTFEFVATPSREVLFTNALAVSSIIPHTDGNCCFGVQHCACLIREDGRRNFFEGGRPCSCFWHIFRWFYGGVVFCALQLDRKLPLDRSCRILPPVYPFDAVNERMP